MIDDGQVDGIIDVDGMTDDGQVNGMIDDG